MEVRKEAQAALNELGVPNENTPGYERRVVGHLERIKALAGAEIARQEELATRPHCSRGSRRR